MKQSPSWEVNQFSASQQIPRTLRNPKVHYRIHKYPPPNPILSHIVPAHALTTHSLNIHINIILFKSGSSRWSLSLNFPQQNPAHTSTLPHTCYMHRPSHFYRFDHRVILGEKYRSLSSSLWSSLQSPVTSSPLGPNSLLSNSFSNTLSLRFPLNVTNQVSHPYKTTENYSSVYLNL